MAKTDLTDEEKKLIIEALNNNTELPPELMTKLFPGLAEKFDVAKLDRAKIVTLEYAGKRSEAAILNQASPTDAGSPLQVERCFRGGSLTGETQLDLFERAKDGTDDNWQNLIVQGDNLQFLKTCCRNADPLIKDKVKGKVKLFYIDPPFATKSDFRGSGDEKSYSDKVDSAEFIEDLRERMIYMREILSGEGSIYVHMDYRKAHYLKVFLDQLFEESNFINQIIWKRTSAHSDSKTLGNAHDIILHFGKSAAFIQNKQFVDYSDEYIKKYYKHRDQKGQFLDRDLTAKGLKGRGYDYEWRGIKGYWRCPISTMQRHEDAELLYYTRKGTPRLKQYLHEKEGRSLQDVWTDINAINSQALERIDYPTQKPEALLERIILASSNPGDLVMDVFAGSGTTAAVAEKLGRHWIVCDFGKHAIYTMQKRMLRIGESKALGSAKGGIKKNRKYGKPPNPFCVVSTGAYDFSRIMKLRDNKDAYIDFVLGLFRAAGMKRIYRANTVLPISSAKKTAIRLRFTLCGMTSI